MVDKDNDNDGNEPLWNQQNVRLGSFLLASSFLIAAFMQLVTACKPNTFLIDATAVLGSIIAYIYFLMNFWLVRPDWLALKLKIDKKRPNTGQVLHTWLIPLFFLFFWIIVGIEFNDFWSSPIQAMPYIIIIIPLILVIPFFYLQDLRDNQEISRLNVIFRCVKKKFNIHIVVQKVKKRLHTAKLKS